MCDHTSVANQHEALLRSIRDTHLTAGQAAFWWFGQITYLLKLGQTTVFCDPYLQPSPHRNKPPLLTPAECADLDVMVCTHDHTDHIDPWAIPQLAEQTQAVFVAPRAVRQRMVDLGVPESRLVALNAGETATVRDVTITAVASAHEFLDRTADGLYPYLGYVMRGNGVTAYTSGDTVWWEGLQAALAEQLPIDVAFVPINGRDAERYRRNCIGNMTFAEACDLVSMLPVGLAVPAHFDMFDGNREDPTRFTEYCAAKYPDQRCWLGPAGQPVIVAAGGSIVTRG
ncbi:MAG: MBL fold metallo-hydrolase [Armatimonadetes bacterium]|nr:MBL fold metallo-hydrolase [Armatimonadota bacterium]